MVKIRSWSIFLSCFITLVATLAHGAQVTAQLDRNPVAEGESVQLILTAEGKVSGQPDFAPLEQDFEILGQSSSTNMQVINGKTSRSRVFRLSLMPRRTGKLIVPALAIGGDASQPLELLVNQQQAASGGGGKGDLFLEVEVSPEKPYVNAQALYTLRLFLGVSLASASLSEPEAENLEVERLGEDREYNTTRNGRNYRVIERQYVLFPQKAGVITIEPVLFQGQVGRSGSFFDPFSRGGASKRVRSEAITLNVQEKPRDAAFPWLPAEKLELSAAWSSPPDKLQAGEPVTLTLTLEGHGLKANRLPDIELPLPDGMKQYPDQPQFQDRTGPGGTIGLLTKKIAILPQNGGEYTLPKLELPWWNTQTGAKEVAVLPPQKVKVLQAVVPEVATNLPETVSQKSESAAVTPVPQVVPVDEKPYYQRLWFWLTVLFCVLWLVTLLLWRRSVKAAGLNTRVAGTEEDVSQQQMEKVQKELQQACKANSPAAARKALSALMNLPEMTDVLLMENDRDSPLALEIEQLNSALYADRDNQSPWQGQGLWQAFHQEIRQKVKGETSSSLRPLYEGRS